MRLFSVRLIVSLIVGITLVSLLSSYYEVRSERRRLRQELEGRAERLGESLASSVEANLQRPSPRELQRIVERFSHRQGLAGVGVYDKQGPTISLSSGLPARLNAQPAPVLRAIAENLGQNEFIHEGSSVLHIYALPLHAQADDQVVGGLAIVHDARYIDVQTAHIWRESFWRVLVQVLLIALTTLLIVRWSIAGPIARAAQWMQALRMGRSGVARADFPESDFLRPLTREVATLAESLTAARTAAEQEAHCGMRLSRCGRPKGLPFTCATRWESR